jgi:hypothetical protein
MNLNQTKMSKLKVLVCALFVVGFSSFSESDPCKPPAQWIRDHCEYDEIITCHVFYTGGPCEGSTYDYPNLRPKQ